MCARGDSNSHKITLTTPSRWRVYQFHHVRNGKRVQIYNRFVELTTPLRGKFYNIINYYLVFLRRHVELRAGV
jgi:hypothetical protein